MSATAEFGASPVVLLDGQPLPAWAVPVLERVVVDDHVHLPDTVALTFRDDARDVVRRLGLRIGSRVEVSATPTGDGRQEPLITAEVTAFEHETGEGGSHATVLGYDLSHRLCRGRRTRSWTDVMDVDIVRELAAEARLPVSRADAGTVVHRHVSQLAMTDWDFLKGRAQETGFEIAVVGGELQWRRPADSGDAPPPADAQALAPRLQLVVGTNLLRFRPRLTSGSQVASVQARGWDPVAKRVLVAEVPAQTRSAEVAVTHHEVVQAFGAGTTHPVVDRSLGSQAEVDAAAHAAAEQVSSAYVEADGEAHGDPRLVAGAAVSVSMAGWPHDGTYTLTSTRHVYDRRGYRTRFTCSGRQERSVLGLMTLGATKGSQSAAGPPIYGVVVGTVTDVADPEVLGRVRVMLPWLSDDYESGWARVAQLGAGSARGAAFLPEVGDEVLIAFDRGDTRRPYVIGQLYNGRDKPKHDSDLVDGASGQVAKRVLASRRGHELLFDEDKGIRLSTSDGGYVLELDEAGTAVTIDSAGTVTVHGTGKVEIKGDADVVVSAASTLTLSGTSAVEISAPDVKVSASAQLDLSGGGTAKLHAGVVQIN